MATLQGEFDGYVRSVYADPPRPQGDSSAQYGDLRDAFFGGCLTAYSSPEDFASELREYGNHLQELRGGLPDLNVRGGEVPSRISKPAWDAAMAVDEAVEGFLREEGYISREGFSPVTDAIAKLIQHAINREIAKLVRAAQQQAVKS